jgi:3-deoxy-D-manno-octulosonic acid (KDO) 8-phosphate synthase
MQYHTNTHGSSKRGFIDGFNKAISEASTNGTNQVLLLTHSLKQLRGGVYERVFGKEAVKKLATTKVAKKGLVTIYLETETSQESAFSKGVIFAPFVSLKLLSAAMLDSRATDIVYIPWAESELHSYVQSNPASTQI